MSDEILNQLSNSNPELAEEVASFESDNPDLKEATQAEGELLGETAPTVAESAPVEAEPDTKPAKSADVVPLPVFLDLKSDLKESKQALKALQEQMEALKNPPPKPVTDDRPAFTPSVRYEDDPATFLKEKIEHQERLIDWQERNLTKTHQMTAEQQRQMQAQQQYSAFTQAVNHAEAEFRNSNPDYDAALAHVQASRIAEAKAFTEASGGTWDAQTAAQFQQGMVREFAQLAATTLQRGRNPAEAIYALAKSRGYQPATKAAEAQLERLEKGLGASRTVSNLTGGRATGGEASSGDWLGDIKRGVYG